MKKKLNQYCWHRKENRCCSILWSTDTKVQLLLHSKMFASFLIKNEEVTFIYAVWFSTIKWTPPFNIFWWSLFFYKLLVISFKRCTQTLWSAVVPTYWFLTVVSVNWNCEYVLFFKGHYYIRTSNESQIQIKLLRWIRINNDRSIKNSTDIFAYITVPVFKLLSCNVLFINRKCNRSC